MSERQPKSIDVIREDRFVEKDANAFVVLSKEESDRILEKAGQAQKAKLERAERTGAADAE